MRKISRWLSIAAFIAASFTLIFAIVNSKRQGFASTLWQDLASSDKKIVSRSQNLRTFPAELSDVKYKGRSIPFRVHFSAPDDWINDISFDVKNLTTRDITRLDINIKFPETRATGNLMAYRIQLGVAGNSNSSSKPRVPFNLNPGETISVSLNDYASDIRNFIAKRADISSIHEIAIELDDAYFDGGLIWTRSSGYALLDPTKPRGHVNISMPEGLLKELRPESPPKH